MYKIEFSPTSLFSFCRFPRERSLENCPFLKKFFLSTYFSVQTGTLKTLFSELENCLYYFFCCFFNRLPTKLPNYKIAYLQNILSTMLPNPSQNLSSNPTQTQSRVQAQ